MDRKWPKRSYKDQKGLKNSKNSDNDQKGPKGPKMISRELSKGTKIQFFESQKKNSSFRFFMCFAFLFGEGYEQFTKLYFLPEKKSLHLNL